MKFDIVKKGYNPTQVEEYIRRLADDDNAVITEQKSAIEQLKEENRRLTEKLENYDRKKEEIFVAFVEAQETSARLKRKATQRFNEEMERLKLFQEKWTAYAKDVVKTLSPEEAEKFENMSKKFRTVLSVYAQDVEIVKPEARQPKKADDKVFEPLKKVAKYLDSVSYDEPSQRASAAQDEPVAETEPVFDGRDLDAEELAQSIVDEAELSDDMSEKAVAQSIAEQAEEAFEIKDISQSEIINVKQSLEDLCKELGIIDGDGGQKDE